MLPFHMSSAHSITNRERYHSAGRDSRSTNRSFSLLALFQKTSANQNSLTSFFSIAITRSSLTFFTLEEISFLFSHSYEKETRYPLLATKSALYCWFRQNLRLSLPPLSHLLPIAPPAAL
jgi:hypothetical protein